MVNKNNYYYWTIKNEVVLKYHAINNMNDRGVKRDKAF